MNPEIAGVLEGRKRWCVPVGDCREVLASMPDGSARCCVTSPPYWGLRDYGVDGQLGLESTPEEYVANMVDVFREVRRVLTDDGTMWLNLGDSYFGGDGRNRNCVGDGVGAGRTKGREAMNMVGTRPTRHDSIKPKDLVGIPWRVAFALQQPYYTGKVANERDRVWLAAMIDAEGSICGTEYEASGRTKTNIYISVTNTSVPIIDKCERLFPQDVKHVYEKTGPSDRICYRWDVERMETKALFIREIYPYLVAKRKQAIVGYTFLEMQCGLPSKKKGYLPEQQERRSWLMAALSKLNAGEDVDLPGWVVEPPSLFEPGFYLRQDIIWAKPNAMPESVTDRCTKAHEYVFLLAKAERYFCNMEAIKEKCEQGDNGSSFVSEYDVATKPGVGRGPRRPSVARGGFDGKTNALPGREAFRAVRDTRNKRSVWTVTPEPFPEAHFATYPPKLIEPCILAGSEVGDLVIDPFNGAGTTGLVSVKHGRRYVGPELNPAYADIARRRIQEADTHLFNEVTA